MSRVSDALAAYADATMAGDTGKQAVAAEVLWSYTDNSADFTMFMGWAAQCGFASGVAVARAAVSAGKPGPEARILRDLRQPPTTPSASDSQEAQS